MRIIQLYKVKYLPKELQPGILYVSEEYSVAGHLCACGCGSKVITPLGPTEWAFHENKGKATLEPSIGNWQLPCRSHYWIRDSKIEWSYKWTEKEINTGWKREENKRKKYYKSRSKKHSIVSKIITWLSRSLGKASGCDI